MIKALKFENFGVSRKEIELIQPFSNESGGGNFIILTGANGSGKSTLLKTLVGLTGINKGVISIDGKCLESYSSEERSRLFAYFNSKKIEEEYIRIIDLVALGRYPYLKLDYAKRKENALIDFYINAMGIADIQNKFLNEISDGELQKASIARALVQDTPIIVMDEPTAFLDYPSKRSLFTLLRNLTLEKGKIIICATHDVELVSVFGTMFWHIGDKTLKFSDKPIDW